MNRKLIDILIICLSVPLTVLFSSEGGDSCDQDPLRHWFEVVMEQPEAIRDSLKTLGPVENISAENRALYGLVRTIADDRTFSDVSSDSLINEVTLYYSCHDPGSKLHIRALTYQGIVRLRMGIVDSSAYMPLMEAIRFLDGRKNFDPVSDYFANYFIGEMYEMHLNREVAKTYFQEALTVARAENDSAHIFDASLALYWNLSLVFSEENQQECKDWLESSRRYLDDSVEREYYLLSAESAYALLMQNDEMMAEKEKEKQRLYPSLRIKGEEFRMNYTLSDMYESQNQLDSADYYIRKSIACAEDTLFRQKYLLYDHAANIAKKKNDFRQADAYREQAIFFQEQSMEDLLNTNIREMDRRYEQVKSKSKTRVPVEGIVLLLLLIFHIVRTLHKKQLQKKTREMLRQKEEVMCWEEVRQMEEALHREEVLQVEEALHREQSRRRKDNSLYVTFLQKYNSLLNRIKELVSKIYKRDADLAEEFDSTLKEGRRNFNELAKEILISDEIKELLAMSESCDKLNESDQVLLSLLAKKIDNEEIAAILSTSTKNLKSKKSYLKKKIIRHVTDEYVREQLLKLFGKN
ncbi:MAG: hypothetical protein LBH72_02820 [Proteiniphilum sp.]|jgi:hypothetical protein|nr:hypothetical protein [Proteiniphilum sp.]